MVDGVVTEGGRCREAGETSNKEDTEETGTRAGEDMEEEGAGGGITTNRMEATRAGEEEGGGITTNKMEIIKEATREATKTVGTMVSIVNIQWFDTL